MKQMTQLTTRGFPTPQPTPPQAEVCASCFNYGHHDGECPYFEEVNAIQPQGGPFSTHYNSQWKNHPNFRWGEGAPNQQTTQPRLPFNNNNNQGQFNHQQKPWVPKQAYQTYNDPPPNHGNQNYPTQTQPRLPVQNNHDIREQLAKMNANQDQMLKLMGSYQGMERMVGTHDKALSKIEAQLGQLANAVARREDGKLPSQPIHNPRNVPTCS